jgi:hypothetical protein
MLGQAPWPAPLLADLADGGQPDAAASWLAAAKARAGDATLGKAAPARIDHRAVAAFLADHLDLELLACEVAEGGRRGLDHAITYKCV